MEVEGGERLEKRKRGVVLRGEMEGKAGCCMTNRCRCNMGSSSALVSGLLPWTCTLTNLCLGSHHKPSFPFLASSMARRPKFRLEIA